MCGILYTNDLSIDDESLNKIDGFIEHRGTLAPVTSAQGKHLFVHTLMPVQGDSPVKQPMSENDETLVFQGELWTHPGFASDTEYLFNKLRESFDTLETVNSLDGMFAFVFKDRNDYVWFATDVFGEQPLYYAETQYFNITQVSVTSEIKQLVALGYDVKQVKACEPGILYMLSSGVLIQRRYHSFDFAKKRHEADTDKIRALLNDSIASHYNSNSLQKSGLLCSGGLDSTILAYELSKLGLKDIFCVSSTRDSIDFANAEIVAEKFDLTLHKILATDIDIDCSIASCEISNRSILEEFCCHLALGKYLADIGVRVVFSGCGAD